MHIRRPKRGLEQHCELAEFERCELRVRLLATIVEMIHPSGVADGVGVFFVDEASRQIDLMRHIGHNIADVKVP